MAHLSRYIINPPTSAGPHLCRYYLPHPVQGPSHQPICHRTTQLSSSPVQLSKYVIIPHLSKYVIIPHLSKYVIIPLISMASPPQICHHPTHLNDPHHRKYVVMPLTSMALTTANMWSCHSLQWPPALKSASMHQSH